MTNISIEIGFVNKHYLTKKNCIADYIDVFLFKTKNVFLIKKNMFIHLLCALFNDDSSLYGQTYMVYLKKM